jgi:hypothetical protein
MASRNQGIQSRNVKRVDQRLGTGGKVGDHATGKGGTGYKGETLYNRSAGTFDPVRYGNEISATTQCGPGGSRTIYKTGSQGQQGNPNPGNPPSRGDLFPGWERK